MPATITKVYPTYGKAGDSAITIIGTGFLGDATKSVVFHRKQGETAWENVAPARVTFVSVTELTIAIDAGNTDGWDPGLNDMGVADFGEGTPDGYIEQALYFYIATADNPDAFIKGAPDAVYIEGRYMGQTHGGLDMDHEVETSDIESDQSLVPLRTIKVGETYSLAVPLGEVTLENIRDVWGIAAAIEELGTGRRRLTFGGDTAVPEKEVMVILPGASGKKFAIIFYRCAIVAPGTMSFNRDDQVDLPLTAKVLADTSRTAGDQVGRWEEYTV